MVAEHIDPIEKKPLFNFLPGSQAFSIGTVGCNFHCKHCQNFDISQYPREHRGKIIGYKRTPEQVVTVAKAAGCETIAYTYTEPTIFYKFSYDTAVLAQEEGIKNVFVSNGYMSAMEILSVFKHALMITVFVFVMMLLVDFIDMACKGRMSGIIKGGLWRQYTLASFLGAIPGCLGAFMSQPLCSRDDLFWRYCWGDDSYIRR